MESRCVMCGANFEDTGGGPSRTAASQFCSSTCEGAFLLRHHAGREPTTNRYIHDGDEGYDEVPHPCVVCDSETIQRCPRCRRPVCHNCIECPNGCDNVANFLGKPSEAY